MNTILRTLLYEWQDRKLPAVIRRDIQLDVTSRPGTPNATVVTGFRRVGKTYMLYEAIEKLLETYGRHDVVYINFEDERLLPPSTDLLTDLIPEIQAAYGQKPKYFFLDELQLVPNWSKWVRRILDTEDIQLFVTGSSAKMSSAELPTELRGRAWEVTVHPLTFREFLRFKGTEIQFGQLAFVKEEKARFRFLFDEYLLFGALPAVVLTVPEKKQELLQTYFQTVVQRDVAERYAIDNNAALRALLKLVLNSSYITISKLHNSLKSIGIAVGKSTIDNYLSYIESSYFMQELAIHSPAVINQLQYPRKVYFIDTGFMTALSTQFSQNRGRLLENVVFQQLSQQGETLHYYKDDKDKEVDFVVFNGGKTVALYQVCSDLGDDVTKEREVRSLIKAGATFNCQNLTLITLEKSDAIPVPAEIHVISVDEFLR